MIRSPPEPWIDIPFTIASLFAQILERSSSGLSARLVGGSVEARDRAGGLVWVFGVPPNLIERFGAVSNEVGRSDRVRYAAGGSDVGGATMAARRS